ncbi:hypothetical protein K1719_020124 [Acacia pycnantha]|nr:hypothetical protein K1719_020124 [Acacia pycnantha]
MGNSSKPTHPKEPLLQPLSLNISRLHICLPFGICLYEEDTTKALAPRFIERDQTTQPQPQEGEELSCRESTRGINGVVLSFPDPRKNWLAAQHMKSVSTGIHNYGLRYDVLYHPYFDLDVKEALNRLRREIVDSSVLCSSYSAFWPIFP